jgi:ABC-2 type transport system permease protein
MASSLAVKRDIGLGLLASRDTARARLSLLSSPTAQTFREERNSLLVWLVGVAAFALIVGIISKAVSSASISPQLQREIAKLGGGSLTTPVGYLSFAFVFFALVLSLFACSQTAAARHEESAQRLETLLALPVGRRDWLGGRLGLATGAAIAIAVCSGLFAWVGASSQGVDVSLPSMLGAGINCLPTALLFLGISALAYGLAPRAGAGIGYGLVIVAFLWQLFGSLIGAPSWLVKLTPVAHIAAVPAQQVRVGAALIMIAIGLGTAAAALAAFGQRDLTGA